MQSFEAFWSMVELNLKAVGFPLVTPPFSQTNAPVQPLFWTHMMLNHFRDRQCGTVINIASRSATVNIPFGVNYAAAKAGLVRATGCLQLEADMDGFHDISFYALHPGATRTNMQKPIDSDVAELYPDIVEAYAKFADNFRCKPALCGQTCVFLAAGKGKVLKGKYFDCEQDVGYVASMAEEIQSKSLYELNVQFLGGLPNDGGTAKTSAMFGGEE